MSRYIEVNNVANAIYHHFPSIRTMADARGIIEEAPSIDIVFCKECENWQTDWVPEGYEGVDDLHYCAVVDGCKFGDFFCADGERREP